MATTTTTPSPPAPIDGDRLMAFVLRTVDEVGATLGTALAVMGDRLGLYRAMAGAGPLTSEDVAARAGIGERYAREWLNAQAAGGVGGDIVKYEYSPASSMFWNMAKSW